MLVHVAVADTMKDNRSSSCDALSYRRLYKLLVWLQAILLVSGCAAFKGFPKRVTDPKEDLAVLQADIGATAITNCLKESSETCRNKIIAARMYAIDIQFSEFAEDLFKQTREGGFAATVATLGLTAAAAASTSSASQILSGIAAFIIGTREAFQKEVLAERTLIAVHTAMRARRALVAVRLRAGLQQSLDAYPLALGLNDLDAYYNAGTVLGALVGITEAVGVEAQHAEEKLLVVSTFARTPAAIFLQAMLASAGRDRNRLKAIETQIRLEMTKQDVPDDISVVDFVRRPDPQFEQQRQAVARALGWTP
jgi:hypothetical protein